MSHHVFIGCHIGAYPLVIGIIWSRLIFVGSFHIDDKLIMTFQPYAIQEYISLSIEIT